MLLQLETVNIFSLESSSGCLLKVINISPKLLAHSSGKCEPEELM
jgi:hypothetical protein